MSASTRCSREVAGAFGLDRLEHARRARFSGPGGLGGDAGGEGTEAEQAASAHRRSAGQGDQLPTLSCWISQRPSAFASTSVLVVLVP